MPPLPEMSPELLFAVAAAICAALVAAGLLALWHGRARRTDAAFETLGRQLAALREASAAQSAMLVAMAAQFDALRREIATDARYAASSPAATNTSAYELAIRLARGGALAEELVSACMMTRHEAELTLRLHGPQNRVGPARLAAVG